MKVLFLDIDGLLNSESYVKKTALSWCILRTFKNVFIKRNYR